MPRWFEVRQSARVYQEIVWRVEADSFDEAEQLVYEGQGEWYDSWEEDSDYGEITSIECRDCNETDAGDCTCVDAEFMAELGL